MRGLVSAVCLLFVCVAADTYCNYDITGEEVLFAAVPIGTYETAGSDKPRKSWCVAGCNTKVSIKATALLLPANGTTPKYNMVRSFSLADRKLYREVRQQGSNVVVPLKDDDDNTFCIDDTVANTVDDVFNKYSTVKAIAQGLAKAINKPGWAVLIIQHIDDSVGEGANLKYDTNFCYKNMFKTINNQDYFFDVVAMAIDDSGN